MADGVDDTRRYDTPRNRIAMLTGRAPGAIERMEQEGTAQLVASNLIPTDLSGITEERLVVLGFKLYPPDPTDPIFRKCELPEGWTRVQSGDRTMFLRDATGQHRFQVFYKAAFYDRYARMSEEPLLRLEQDLGAKPMLRYRVLRQGPYGAIMEVFAVASEMMRPRDPQDSSMYREVMLPWHQELDRLQGICADWVRAEYPDSAKEMGM